MCREARHAERLAAAGAALGEPAEVSTVRREDLAAHAGRAPHDDLHQADSLPSTAVSRGHQVLCRAVPCCAALGRVRAVPCV